MLVVTRILVDLIDSRGATSQIGALCAAYLHRAEPDTLSKLIALLPTAGQMAIRSAFGQTDLQSPLSLVLDEDWGSGLPDEILAMPVSTPCGVDCWSAILRADSLMASIKTIDADAADAIQDATKRLVAVYYCG